MQAINLIPTHRTQAKRQRRNVRRWVALTLGYATMLTVVSVLCQTVWSDVDRSQTHQLAQVAERIEQSNAAITALQPQLAHVRLSLAIEQQIVSQPDWSILLAMLGEVMGEDIVLRECELTPLYADGQRSPSGMALMHGPNGTIKLGAHQYQLHLSGLGRSQSAVSRFVLRLEETRLFEQVKLINTMREPVRGIDAFSFKLECTLGEAAPVDEAKKETGK